MTPRARTNVDDELQNDTAAVAPLEAAPDGPTTLDKFRAIGRRLGEGAILREDEVQFMFGIRIKQAVEKRWISETIRRVPGEGVKSGYRFSEIMALADRVAFEWGPVSQAALDVSAADAVSQIAGACNASRLAKLTGLNEEQIVAACRSGELKAGSHHITPDAARAWLEQLPAFPGSPRLAVLVGRSRVFAARANPVAEPEPPSAAEKVATQLEATEQRLRASDVEDRAINWRAYRKLIRDGGALSDQDAESLALVCESLGIDSDRLRADMGLLERVACLQTNIVNLDEARAQLRAAIEARNAERKRAKQAERDTWRAETIARDKINASSRAIREINEIKQLRPELFETIREGADVREVAGVA